MGAFRYLSLVFLITFLTEEVYPQLQLTPGEHFLAGLNIVKVKVTPEDHITWALSDEGKVYYKKEADPDFQEYPLTVGLVVAHFTGFNANEMYFHIAPDKLIQIMNNVKTIIPISFPGVTRINDIAAVNQHKDTPYYQFFPTVFNNDWIAIATNKHMYRLIRGTSVIRDQYPYANPPFYNEPDWEITNDAFKSVDFRYRHPVGGRCFDADHVYHNSFGPTIYESVIPEVSPYPSKINCTLFGFHWNQPFHMWSSFKFLYNYWGTDEGLYLKEFACSNQPAKKVISGQVINDLEEIHALTAIYKQNYLLAATNTGIWFTPASIFRESESAPFNNNRTSFIALSSFPLQRVNSISTDTEEYGTIDVGSGDTYTSVCEKVIWTGTDDGVRKIYVIFDQSKFDGLFLTSFSSSKQPVYDNSNNAIFETCGNEAIDISLILPNNFLSQLLIQWFKDGVEVPGMLGKKAVQLSGNGTYRAKITSLCEGIYTLTVPFKINNSTAPEITFNYSPEMNLCEGKTLTLTTVNKSGYQYRWFKDNQIISSATSSNYIVNQAGTYRVEVSNCANNFQPSSSVKVNSISLSVPVIQSLKNTYCSDESAELQINSASNFKIRWYLNGVELPQYANANKIIVNTSGAYTVSVENAEDCQKSSAAFNLQFVSPPDVQIIRNKVLPLCNNETVTLSTNQSGGTFLWSTGETTPSIRIHTPKTYAVTVTNSAGCSKRADVDIEMLPAIILSGDVEEKICTISSEKLILKAEKGYRFYTWNGVKTDQDALMVQAPGSYTLTVEDLNGCKASKIFTVIAWCKEIVIPNTFTPNNDGKNDYWTIGGLEDDNSAKLMIYNRNGSLIYEKRGCCISWDGQLNGTPLPVGSYFYILTTSNSKNSLKGTITILR